MASFKKKRESLELFVEEQIIGPGAFNKKYFFLTKYDEHEFKGKIIKSDEIKAIDNKSEIITELPAYQYSSAILFPEVKVVPGIKTSYSSEEGIVENEEEEENVEITMGTDDEEMVSDVDENLISKQQNYPNSIGLTFVINNETNINKDFTVKISAAKYKKITKLKSFDNKLACLVNEYENEIKNILNNYFSPLFDFVQKDENLFIFIKNKIDANNIYDIDYLYFNNYTTEIFLPKLASIFGEKLIEIKNENGVSFLGIEDKLNHQIIFYSIRENLNIKGEKNYKKVVTIFEEKITSYLKNELLIELSNYNVLKELIKEFEIYNQLKSYISNLKSVYKAKDSLPVWESTSFEDILINLPNFESDISFFRSKELSIEDEKLTDLKYFVQYIRQNNRIFVKIILVNRAFVNLKENEPPQLNKKDEANKKAYFGFKIKVEEKIHNQLQQYNPPQLLNFDEEDNFTKLLYRNYLDFGEGYNTSIDWGKNQYGLKYVSTNFLPSQETPKVDFKPSRITENLIVSRLKNEDCLSMYFLSTLSNATKNDIITSLKEFVKQYNIWIEEKNLELSNDLSLEEYEKKLLNKQLLSCSNDYQRLVRNISILEKNDCALAAFRLMNTAMFMQLHHGILKKNKDLVLKSNLSEEYYKDLKSDYKWRSFQIAFILLNIDAFVKPELDDQTVKNIFSNGWPERNEIADLVWFPTGGGKTEAYLGIIAFMVCHRRFNNGEKGGGTSVLMRYTLRLLTLQQFQRATLLMCALEIIRKDKFQIDSGYNLGEERITIGLFVGSGSLPNSWESANNVSDESSMKKELEKIQEYLSENEKSKKNRESYLSNIKTNLPFTNCPWCDSDLFIDSRLNNVATSSKLGQFIYGINDQLNICCNNKSCAFSGKGENNRPTNDYSLPLRLFDEDIYKYPPTLLFGTVDKFAALANKVSNSPNERNKDSSRLFGKGYKFEKIPPELIIQDELHLLLGPLGSAVGLFEKSIDYLCTYTQNGFEIKPKIVTSTATTRNTDKQIFALFNRRAEIFPKQGILSDDSFFAFYERNEENLSEYSANRKYVGLLPIGKTQVWMQLRIAAITLVHRIKYFKECFKNNIVLESPETLKEFLNVFDYYHTVLSYFNSLKDVGKTQSQLNHYLPGDVNLVMSNTISWSIVDKLIRDENSINYSELTGRLNGEEVKSNLSTIEKKWDLFSTNDAKLSINQNNPPEFVISTNMISVGIDISRFNTMIISSMPRNIAEYIQASSRVARNVEGIVFTVHHPYRSRDISHYQRFKEFHEKFYGYVEPISVTPFASKALERYLPIYLAVMIRHNLNELKNNDNAVLLTEDNINSIKNVLENEINTFCENANKLDYYLKNKIVGISSSVEGIITEYEIEDFNNKVDNLFKIWNTRISTKDGLTSLHYRTNNNDNESLFALHTDSSKTHWKVGYSLREIDPSVVIKTVQQ